MKTKLNSGGELPLNKGLELYMIIVARSVFYEDNKYYLQAFLDEYLYKLQILQDRIDVSEGNDFKKAMVCISNNKNS